MKRFAEIAESIDQTLSTDSSPVLTEVDLTESLAELSTLIAEAGYVLAEEEALFVEEGVMTEGLEGAIEVVLDGEDVSRNDYYFSKGLHVQPDAAREIETILKKHGLTVKRTKDKEAGDLVFELGGMLREHSKEEYLDLVGELLADPDTEMDEGLKKVVFGVWQTMKGAFQEQAKEPKLGSGKRFKKLEKELGKRSDVKDPKALAAWIGAKKYGRAKMQKMAAAGRK